MFDKDGDGTISAEELKIVLKAIGQNPTDTYIEEILESKGSFDPEANERVLGYEEFVILMSSSINDNKMEEDMVEVFNTFDKQKKGYINLSDLKMVFK